MLLNFHSMNKIVSLRIHRGHFPADFYNYLLEILVRKIFKRIQVLFKLNLFVRIVEWHLDGYNATVKKFEYESEVCYEVLVSIKIRRKFAYYLITMYMPSYVITSICIIGW